MSGAAQRLEERLRATAAAVAASGGQPLALAPAGAAWLVAAGAVELFAAPVAADGGWGPRTHLGTAAAGQLLFGADPDASGGLALLAIAPPGTRLLRLAADALSSLARDPDLVAGLAAQVDGWLSLLFSRLPRPAPPKVYQELRPGDEVEIAEEGRAARGREGVVWVQVFAGSARLLGEPDLAHGPEPQEVVALPEASWLVSGEATRLVCLDTVAVLRAGGLGAGLSRFHAVLLRLLALHAVRAEGEERERLERRANRDRLALAGAYARLASVLAPLAAGEIEPEEAADPLLAACRLVGRAQGFAVRPPLELSGGVKQGDRLVAICAASRVRYRRVILRDDWWQRDNGPLLAFRVADSESKRLRPVALLPTSSRSYELADPAEPARLPVDAAVAESLSGDAYMFYPPLPSRPLNWRDLLRSALGERREDLTTIALMGLAGGLLGLLVPLVTGQVFGQTIPGGNRSQLWQMTLALVAGAFAGAAFQITRSIAVLRLGGKMDGTMQAAVWDRLLALPVSFFRRFTVGDLAVRSLGIDAIRELLTGNVVTSVLSAVFSVLSFALLFYYSWRLALVASGLVAVLVATTALLTWLQLRHQRALQHLQGKIASLLFGLIGGLPKLRVGGAEQRAFALWAHRFAEQRQRTFAAQRVANLQATFNATYGVLASLALFAMVGLSLEGGLPVGDFLAFNAAFGQFLAAALAMVGVFSGVLAMVPIYERLQPILTEVPEVDAQKPDAGELAGEIEFSHVSFRYQEGGPPILDDVSFRARPGEFIALVGPSGAGKSTCLRLVLGFERPTTGSIYFDGQDLATIGVQSVRRQIGVVLQSGRPMVGSLYSNIVGSANLPIEDAWEAARMAGLAEDIEAMPMGMHTVISEGAETFSGGQKQRLLIARAIVRRPRIILFDEATSALDNRTQEIVSQSLERLKATRIVIAHRLSTIAHADRIYVLAGGRVVESGAYEELANRGGAFSRLVARQIA
jgi:NHLM bacteriocin system ABC transporter ATP-binding protein